MTPRTVNKLKALGTTKAEVAENLTIMGIKGVKMSCANCPIAHYIRRTSPLINRALGTVLAGTSEWYMDFYRHPQFEEMRPIYEFIKAFDSGDYPELEEDQ